MSDAILTCPCGHAMRVSEFAVGSKGKCGRCGAVLTVTETNIRPMAEVQLAAVARPGQAVTASDDACGRCGKTFRGEWDRVETALGAICHHCSVLAVEAIPEHLQRPKTKDERGIDTLAAATPETETRTKSTFFGIDTESPRFKRMLLALAVGTIVLTIYLVLTDSPPPSGPPLSGDTVREVTVPPWLETMLSVWGYAVVFLAGYFALWIALASTHNLPEDSVWRNAFVLFLAAITLFAMHFVLTAAAALMAGLPLAGAIFAVLLTLVRCALAYWILDWFFDLGLKEFIITFIIYAVLKVMLDTVFIAVAGSLYHVVL